MSLPGTRGQSKQRGSYIVASEDRMPFRVSGWGLSQTTKLKVSAWATSQWIHRARSIGRLSSLRSKFLTGGAQCSSRQVLRTSSLLGITLVSKNPRFASIYWSSFIICTLSTAFWKDLSRSWTYRTLRDASMVSEEKFHLCLKLFSLMCNRKHWATRFLQSYKPTLARFRVLWQLSTRPPEIVESTSVPRRHKQLLDHAFDIRFYDHSVNSKS